MSPIWTIPAAPAAFTQVRKKRRNDSIPNWIFFVIFAVLLVIAEHASPFVPVGEWTGDYLIEVREGGGYRQFAYLLLATVAAVLLVSKPSIPIRIEKLLGSAVGGLFLWLLLSALWSDEPLLVLKRLFVLTIVLFWAFVMILRWPKATVIAFTAFSSACSIAVSVGAEVGLGRFSPTDLEYRLGGTLHPNELGLMSMILILACLVGRRISPARRGVYSALLLMGIVTLLMTKSRTALIGTGCGVLMFFHLTFPLVKRVFWISLVGCLLSVVALSDIELVERGNFSRTEEEPGTLNGRIPLWEQCITYYVSVRPLTGFGYTTFWTTRRITEVSSAAGWGVAAAHSAFLELILDLGFVGLALYCILVTTSARLIRRDLLSIQNSGLLFSASLIFSLLVIGLTESELPFRSSAIYFYSLIGLFLPGAIDRPLVDNPWRV